MLFCFNWAFKTQSATPGKIGEIRTFSVLRARKWAEETNIFMSKFALQHSPGILIPFLCDLRNIPSLSPLYLHKKSEDFSIFPFAWFCIRWTFYREWSISIFKYPYDVIQLLGTRGNKWSPIQLCLFCVFKFSHLSKFTPNLSGFFLPCLIFFPEASVFL